MAAPKSSPVPIRFSPKLKERLQVVSEDCGLNVSDICRLAVEQFLAEIERTGRITLTLSESASGYRVDHKKAKKSNPKSI